MTVSSIVGIFSLLLNTKIHKKYSFNFSMIIGYYSSYYEKQINRLWSNYILLVGKSYTLSLKESIFGLHAYFCVKR